MGKFGHQVSDYISYLTSLAATYNTKKVAAVLMYTVMYTALTATVTYTITGGKHLLDSTGGETFFPVPGPEVGAGLSFVLILAAFGCYKVLRSRRSFSV